MPWSDGDVVAVTATALIGMVAIVAGWFGTSGSPVPASQMLWLNIAVAGFAIFASGNCLWLMRLRRALGERRAGLVSFEDAEVMPQHATAADRPVDGPVSASTAWVRGIGMARVHRAGCPLVAGKELEPVRAGDGELCGVCSDG